MAELRWHPLIKDWVMIASHRQDRPQMPEDWCPFCPGSGRVPNHYDVLKYDNDFPVLSQDPPEPDDVVTGLYRTREAYGKCEVILYSPDHNTTLPELPLDHINKLVDLWTERFVELKKDEKIKYIFIFENRGEVVGVTMPHPHGQIYGYSYIPKKLELELDACRDHYRSKHSCLICDMLKDEVEAGQRVIFENEDFLVFLPFFTEYPYGMYIASKKHMQNLAQFSDSQKRNLAAALKETAGTLDALFGYKFPYMMCMHQDPVNSGDFSDYYHFHIEFFPPMRSAEKQKFNASSETGAWAHANPTKPEEKAEELRQAHARFLDATMAHGGTEGSSMDMNRLKQKFIEVYGSLEEGIRVFAAPGRVNLIGEHIDYNGGYVFPAALTMQTTVIARPRRDRTVNLAATDLPSRVSASLDELEKFKTIEWGNYQLGVADELQKAGYKLTGCDLLYDDTVPHGAGLSSSAAIEVATALALVRLGNEAYGLDRPVDLVEIALISQKAENNYVGVNCGIMDQFASAMGKRDHAILLNARDLSYKLVHLDMKGYRIVISNTNKKRSLASSKYNERRSECEKGLEMLKEAMPGITSLGEASYEDFVRHKDMIHDDTIRRRAEHAVSENARVQKSVEALEKGDICGFGRLMVESHISLKELYEVTGAELDTLVEEALKVEGVIGSRMTGAGFGGCTVSIVRDDAVERFKKQVGEGYSRRIGLEASFYVSEIGDGAREIFDDNRE